MAKSLAKIASNAWVFSNAALLCMSLAMAMGCMYSASVLAGEKLDIYSAAVEVKDNSTAQRRRAIAQALSAVYVKASGDLQVVQRYPSLESTMRKAATYVSSYQYYDESREPLLDTAGDTLTSIRDPALAEDTLPDNKIANENTVKMLQVSFAPETIQRNLQAVGAQLWQATRPTVLVWLVLEQGGQRRIVNHDSDAIVWAQLEQQAQLRAVPLVQPLLDLEEQLLVGSEDVWSMDIEKIRSASKRYNADYILVGKLANTYSQQWLGQWLVVDSLSRQAQRYTLQSQQQFAQAGINLIADNLAKQFSVAQYNASGKRQYTLNIDAVNSAEAYLKLNRYLQLVEGLDNLQLRSIENNNCSFVFESTGELENLDALLRLGGKLQPAVMPSGISAQLTYSWRG